jgi:hypothetical protein
LLGRLLPGAPNDISTLNQHFFQRAHHQHAAPIYWHGTEHGHMLFCWGENGNLRAWSLAANGVAAYLACSAEVASAQSRELSGGMMCLSANGAAPNTAVLWACVPYLDANAAISPGRLLAYDATAFGTFAEGSKQLRVLWDSQDWNLTFSFCKFTPPVVANGKLYVPDLRCGRRRLRAGLRSNSHQRISPGSSFPAAFLISPFGFPDEPI